MAESETSPRTCDPVFAGVNEAGVPIYCVRSDSEVAELDVLDEHQRQWLQACDFKAMRRSFVLVPAADGKVAAVLFGIGNGDSGEPCGPGAFLLGDLAQKLPPGTYSLADGTENADRAALAWGLGCYEFARYKARPPKSGRRLVMPEGVDGARVKAITEAVWLGRDMINTPASDMGPEEIEQLARGVAVRQDASVNVVTGDELLAQNFPMIHAVGRASPRAPRLVDVQWGRPDAPKVTLVGKGICFDTGGLDLKPASAMLLMKKDMGGAATALALADMIMRLGVDVRLRLLLAVAENSVAGNAFRPGDILPTRAGFNVEIGNTDAEGRLVLGDALALADEDSPDLVATFATLTGAARVALGADLPAMFATDDDLAAQIYRTGIGAADPVWRMPFWPGYDKNLEHGVGDFNNISEGGFAGAITAALFLKRFVKKAGNYVHFDLYGWRQAARPLGPKGGEPHVARTMLEVVEGMAG
jgi:leucyl aminopeptidase